MGWRVVILEVKFVVVVGFGIVKKGLVICGMIKELILNLKCKRNNGEEVFFCQIFKISFWLVVRQKKYYVISSLFQRFYMNLFIRWNIKWKLNFINVDDFFKCFLYYKKELQQSNFLCMWCYNGCCGVQVEIYCYYQVIVGVQFVYQEIFDCGFYEEVDVVV